MNVRAKIRRVFYMSECFLCNTFGGIKCSLACHVETQGIKAAFSQIVSPVPPAKKKPSLLSCDQRRIMSPDRGTAAGWNEPTGSS